MADSSRAFALLDDLRTEIGALANTDHAREVARLSQEAKTKDEELSRLRKIIHENKTLVEGVHNYREAVVDLVKFLDDRPFAYPTPTLWHRDLEEHLRKVRHLPIGASLGIGA